MQKKLLAAAVLSAFAGVASAQSANVTLYGTLIGSFENASSTGGDSTTAAGAAGVNSSARGTPVIGAATAGAVGPPVVAGTASPTAGGVSAGAYTATPANQSQRNRMNPAGSNFGLRGTEDLGNGLSAWFQIEIAATLGAPAGSPAGANHGNAPSYRNSAVGLRSNTWGTVALGSWDTPFNVLYGTTNANARTGGPSTTFNANLMGATTFGFGAWSSQNVLAAGCTAATGSTAGGCFSAGTNFDRRQNGLVQWWSPNWNGFELRTSYATPQESNGTTADNRVAGAQKYAIWDLTATYTNGPLMLGYGYQRQKDLLSAAVGNFGTVGAGTGTGAWAINSATVSGSTGTGHRLGGRYAFAMGGGNSIGVGALWESLKWTLGYTGATAAQAAAGTADLSELKKTAYRLQANFTTGNHFFGLEYLRANELKGSVTNLAGNSFNGGGTASKGYILSYNYMMSKRTSLTAFATIVTNDNNANYSGIVFGGVPTAAGGDPKYYGLNLRHAF